MTEEIIIVNNYSNICRVCLMNGELQSVFNITTFNNNNISIADAIMACASVQINIDDPFPLQICTNCLNYLNLAYKFRQNCEKTDLLLRKGFVLSNVQNDMLENDYFEESSEEFQVNTEKTIFISDETQEEKIIEDDIENLRLQMICHDEVIVEDVNSSTLQPVDEERNRKTVSCTKCFKDFTSNQIKSHMKIHKNRKCLVCNICKQQFSLSCNLRRHMMLHTGEQPKTHSDNKPYTCHICGQQFTFNCNLRRHIMTHTGERPYTCPVCNKGFIQSNNLVNHMRIHTGESPFKCEICQRKFRKSSNLRSHVETKHGNGKNRKKNGNKGKNRTVSDREYLCEICRKTYLSKGALKTHMLIHGDKKFLCSECGKGFVSKPLLQSHSKIHSGIKPYHCTTCDRYFSHYVSLKAHTLIHTGEKPFACKVCGKLFKQRHHLTYHLRTHSGEKPFLCSVCNKRFSLNCNLIVHMRLHSGETPFLCSTCGKGFYDSSSMKKHFRGHANDSKISSSEKCKPQKATQAKKMLTKSALKEGLKKQIQRDCQDVLGIDYDCTASILQLQENHSQISLSSNV